MKAKDFYSSIAEKYEAMIADPKIACRIHSDLRDMFSRYRFQSGSVLDIGCGPGNLKMHLGDGFDYTGIDPAEGMQQMAAQRGYTVIPGRAEDVLPTIPAKSYDFVVAMSSLHFVEEIGATLRQFERIAKIGYAISFDRMTDQYRRGFSTVVDDPVYNHFDTRINGATEDITIPGWVSPRDGEVIQVRLVLKVF